MIWQKRKPNWMTGPNSSATRPKTLLCPRPPLVKLEAAEIARIRRALIDAGLLGAERRDAA